MRFHIPAQHLTTRVFTFPSSFHAVISWAYDNCSNCVRSRMRSFVLNEIARVDDDEETVKSKGISRRATLHYINFSFLYISFCSPSSPLLF